MKIRTIFIFIFTVIYFSCKTNNRENLTPNAMSWKADPKNNKLLTFESHSKESEQLTSDIENVFKKIQDQELLKSDQLLIYIDASNGNIFISGYDDITGDVFDESGIWIELQELLEVNDDAHDFDEIVIKSIKNAFKTKIGQQVKQQFQIYYQNETGDSERLK